jgi:tRNA modification GTPase
VTSIAGTTRDVLELTLDVGGLPVRVVDTAGLRDTPDVVERIGVARAKEAVAQADVALCVLAADALAEDAEAHVKDVVALVGESTLVLVNKTDAVPASSATDLPLPSCGPIFMGSVTTGVGMRTFVDGLAQVLKARFDYAAEGAHAPLITHARHRAHLERAAEFLDAFLVAGVLKSLTSAVRGADMRADGSDVVVAAEELRYAAKEIGKVTGAIGSEDVLDVVFGSFCIGK